MWHIVMSTPEYPEGRPIILIANDVTHNAGSFGPTEDLIFYRASELARRLGIPRIFLAANTGARIRLADEVKAVFKIDWVDEKHPDKVSVAIHRICFRLGYRRYVYSLHIID